MRGAPALVLLCGCRGLLGIDGVSNPPPPDTGTSIDMAGDPGGDGPAMLGCPGDFVNIPGAGAHLYKLLIAADDWSMQVENCELVGNNVYLAIPDDLAELSGIHSLTTAAFWIGIDDLAMENTFVTVKGAAAMFLPWAGNQPNDLNNQDCVAVLNGGLNFDDQRCADAQAAVCECEP